MRRRSHLEHMSFPWNKQRTVKHRHPCELTISSSWAYWLHEFNILWMISFSSLFYALHTETLVEHPFAKGTSKSFLTIAPEGKLERDVLTMVACMLTYNEWQLPMHEIKWWLSTQFMVS